VLSRASHETAVLSPRGNITARVATARPEQIPGFRWKQETNCAARTESEDKTAAVVDVEAKLKNRLSSGQPMRRMLTRPASAWPTAANPGETREAQAELAASHASARASTNETEKVYVEIAFHAETADD